MKILALDTSSPYLSIAIFDKDQLLVTRRLKNRKTLSQSLMGWITTTLEKSELKLKDLDGFIVGLGPGYFTSLRVGLSSVKGMAFALEKPVAGISSLDLITEGLKKIEHDVCVITDAKRNLLYTAYYQCKNGVLKKIGKDRLLSIEIICAELKGKVLFAGDGIPLAKDVIVKHKSIDPVFADEKYWYPQAKYSFERGTEALKKCKEGDNGMCVVPEYLYTQDCQVQK